jgi:hypothetical protein
MSTMTATPETTSRAAAFVDAFATGWALGASPAFFEHFQQHMHPDVVFEQPLAATTHGPQALHDLFDPLFAAIPDLRGEVLRWGATHDGVIIELELHGTFGRRPIVWRSVDRIVLDDDGRVVSRKACFDPLPLLGQMARRPLALIRLLPTLRR